MKLNQSLLFTCPNCQHFLMHLVNYHPQPEQLQKPRAKYYHCEHCHKRWVDTQASSLSMSGYSKIDVAKALFTALFMLATVLFFALDFTVDLFWFLDDQTNFILKLIGILGSVILIFTVIIPASKKDAAINHTRFIEVKPENPVTSP